MEFLAISEKYLDEYAELKATYDGKDPQAFVFLLDAKEKKSDLVVENGVAKIDITGTLGNSWWSGTEYSEIIRKTLEAEKREDVIEIEYNVDSPGGQVSGLEEAARAIKTTTKKTTAIVKNVAASAAYWLASQTDKIISKNNSAIFGSIGVMAVFYDLKEMMKKDGVKEIKIISSYAPDKNPDPATEEGKKKYQLHVDKLHGLFVDAVAEGRNTTAGNINENYGKGGVVFSDEALKAGMIDNVDLNINETPINNNEEENEMAGEKTYSEAEFNAAVKAAKDEGVKAGIETERKRVNKHLSYLGEAKNETLLENIESGKTFAECVEGYAEEKYAKKELESRIDEQSESDASHGGNGDGGESEDVIATHEALFGKK